MPETIRFDHGPEFTSILMLRWGAEHRLRLHFIDHSKPARNGQVESFNGRVRDELLNPNCFANVHEARSATEDGLIDYNELRPHSALGYRTPQEFITAFQQSTHQLSAANLWAQVRPFSLCRRVCDPIKGLHDSPRPTQRS